MEPINISVPRIATNDDFVTIGQWCVETNTLVQRGQLIAVLETTKESKDLVAEEEGYISILAKEGSEVPVGEIIAEIHAELQKDNAEKAIAPVAEKVSDHFLSDNISKKAKVLIEKYNLDINRLPHDRIVREQDVLKLLNQDVNAVQSKANEIIIVCGGNVAKMCIDAVRLMGGYRLGGITDMYAERGASLMDVPVLGDIDVLPQLYAEGYRTAVNAFGGLVSSNDDSLFFARKDIFEKIKNQQFFLPNIIHPKANIEISATMGEGNLVFANAYVGSKAYVGDDCIINTGAIVSHDCQLGNHCRVSPGAVLAGNVSVGENTIIGMGVTVYMNVKIGKNVIVYNGKHIFSDVPDNTIVR